MHSTHVRINTNAKFTWTVLPKQATKRQNQTHTDSFKTVLQMSKHCNIWHCNKKVINRINMRLLYMSEPPLTTFSNFYFRRLGSPRHRYTFSFWRKFTTRSKETQRDNGRTPLTRHMCMYIINHTMLMRTFAKSHLIYLSVWYTRPDPLNFLKTWALLVNPVHSDVIWNDN